MSPVTSEGERPKLSSLERLKDAFGFGPNDSGNKEIILGGDSGSKVKAKLTQGGMGLAVFHRNKAVTAFALGDRGISDLSFHFDRVSHLGEEEVVGMDRIIINLAHLGSDKEALDRLEPVLVDWVEESVRQGRLTQVPKTTVDPATGQSFLFFKKIN